MAPKKPETIEERMLVVEMLQEQQEDHLRNLDAKVCEIEEAAQETREMLVQTNGLVAAVPATVRDTVREELQKRGLNSREIATLVMLVVATVASVAGVFF